MAPKSTIEDIARLAEVSRGTVSRVLNSHPSVSDNTRTRVLDVIETLNYSPNFSARHMRTETSNMFGFETDEVTTTPYAVDILRGAQETLRQHGKVLLVISAGYDFETTQSSMEVLIERRVEGLIYATMFHREVELPPQMSRIPTVLANCYAKDRSLPSVVPDEVVGGYHAARALLEKGHLRIAFINLDCAWGTPIPPLPASEGRLKGFRQAHEEFGIPFDESLLYYTDQRPQTNYAITLELMQRANPPTAIFCGNDRTAVGCYNGLMSLGLRIPDDVAVVGFDNQISICESVYPQLTTVQLPHYEMGKWAAEYLLSSQGSPLTPVQHQIECRLVRRQSV
jgi:LacI family transcriptional regulator